MSVQADARLRTHLRYVLEHAGLSVDAEGDELSLDLRGLDRTSQSQRRDTALRTAAGLLLSPNNHSAIVAQLPEEARGRRALAASGLMFALAECHARVSEARPASEEWALFTENAVDRLTSFESWRESYTPFDYQLRELMLPDQPDTRAHGAGLGIFDNDFVAFVNPHQLTPGTELRAIASVASPWFARLLAHEKAEDSRTVARTMEILGHALDNVRDHAFEQFDTARSLVTMGVVATGGRAYYQVQILDNGVGIPHSIGSQIGEPIKDVRRALELVGQVVHGGSDEYEPVLPPGRNLGLPAMRNLAGNLGGELTITTAGPDGSQIAMDCVGSKPSDPRADLIPVAGTVVSLRVPLPEPSAGENESRVELLEYLNL